MKTSPPPQLLPSSRERLDSEWLSGLISVVYDAAIDQLAWEEAIEEIAYVVGGTGAGLFCKDVNVQHAVVSHSFGIVRPLPVRLFRQIYPVIVGHFLTGTEEPVATTDLIAHDRLVETALYREWAEPQGLIDFVSAVLDKSAASVAMFGVFRHQRNGFVDDEARHRMRLIIPHVRRAVLISQMFDLKITEAGTFADTLDGLGAGLYLVDSGGRIVHANAAGHDILDAGDVLQDTGGHLAARDTLANHALREVFAAAGQGDAAVGVKGIAVPLMARDGERYIAHALPLTSGARRRAGVTYTAVAALFVRKAALPLYSEALAKTFGLTPAELRVLHAIVEVGGVPEVAAALGVADTTVRTHVGHLFEKTGAARQADLVKLFAAYATPLRN